MPGASLSPLKPQWDFFFNGSFSCWVTSVCFSGSREVLTKSTYSVNAVLIFLKASTKFSMKLMLLGSPRGWTGARQESGSSLLIWGILYWSGQAAGKTFQSCWSHHICVQLEVYQTLFLPHKEIKGQSSFAWCCSWMMLHYMSPLWSARSEISDMIPWASGAV